MSANVANVVLDDSWRIGTTVAINSKPLPCKSHSTDLEGCYGIHLFTDEAKNEKFLRIIHITDYFDDELEWEIKEGEASR